MTKITKGLLRKQIRQLLFNEIENGFANSEVVDQVIKKYPDILEPEKDRLIRAALAHIVRQVRETHLESMQLSLPGFPNMSGFISIRLGAKNGPKTNLRLLDATEAQLDKAIEELKKPSVTSNKLAALDQIKQQLEVHKKEHKLKPKRDATIGDILGLKLAKQQK